MSESENQRRLRRRAGYAFEPSRAGKHLWKQPSTERLLPEDHALLLVRQEEERLTHEENARREVREVRECGEGEAEGAA